MDTSERFWRKVEKTDGCWLWRGAKTRNGYGNFFARGHYVYAHRFAWELHNGPIPTGQYVLHNCAPNRDNRGCVNPTHLFTGSQFDNMRDASTKGTLRTGESNWMTRNASVIFRGERNPMARLNEKDIHEIRARSRTGESLRSIGLDYGLTPQGIHDIVKRRTWRHLADANDLSA